MRMDGQICSESLTESNLIYRAPACSPKIPVLGKAAIWDMLLLVCSFLTSSEGWFLCIPYEALPFPSSHWWVTNAKLQVIQPFPGKRDLKIQESQTLRDLAKSASYKICAVVGNWTQISGNRVIPLGHPAFLHTYIKEDLQQANNLAYTKESQILYNV